MIPRSHPSVKQTKFWQIDNKNSHYGSLRIHLFSFNDKNSDILFTSELDKMNFSEVPANTCFGEVQNENRTRLYAFDDHEKEVGETFFHVNDKKIKLSKTMMPAMLTLDEAVIRQDCLCYLMERLPYPKGG